MPRWDRSARVRRVSSAATTGTEPSTSTARRVMSPRLPIGVETIHNRPAADACVPVNFEAPTSTVDVEGVAERILQERAQLARDARLQLTHALARYAEFVAELLQGEGFLRHHALIEND